MAGSFFGRNGGEIVTEPCDHSDGGEIVVTCWDSGLKRIANGRFRAEIERTVKS